MERTSKILGVILSVFLIAGLVWADEKNLQVNTETAKTVEQPESQPKLVLAESLPPSKYVEPVKYTLGPDDVIQIDVLRHPEFSGIFPINMEGKIQYKFVGDIDVTGLNKQALEEKITEVISSYVIKPEVNVTILEYKSKVIYVVGEVSRPGKYYMRSDSIPIREAVIQAGLPTLAAATRKCRLITPNENGKGKIKYVNLYSLLYGGELSHNVDMHPGDILYVPATVMAKVMRVIRPVTEPVKDAASTARTATVGF